MSGNEPKARKQYLAMVTTKQELGCHWWYVKIDKHDVPRAYHAQHPEAYGAAEVIRMAIVGGSLEERYDITAMIVDSIDVGDGRKVYSLST